MRSILFFIIFLPLCVYAQNERFPSRSAYTLVYQLKFEEAKKIQEAGTVHIVNSKYLHTLVDSFPDKNPVRPLPVGAYLFVKANGTHIDIGYHTVSKISSWITNNHTDLSILVQNQKGENLADADVRLDGKKITFDTSTRSYRIPKNNKAGFVEVKHPSGSNFFYIKREKNSSLVARALNEAFVKEPLGFLKKPFQKNYHGYMVFNKPKYLPGDTVKMKAFIVKNKKPINATLELNIIQSYYGKKIFSDELKPVSDGAYIYEFILGDSLDIDKFYTFKLSHAHKNNSFHLSNSFVLEDYQLNEAQYELYAEKTHVIYGESPILNLSAKDANGLPMPDANVEITLETESINNFYQEEMYIPLVLWKHSQAIDANGKTKIFIPDSLIPDADMKLNVKARFSNSNHEIQEKTLEISIDRERENIKAALINDQIKAFYIHKGEEESTEGTLLIEGNNQDTLEFKKITFPFSEKVNPLAQIYVFKSGKISNYYYVQHLPSLVSHEEKRTKDSASFHLYNPRQLEVSYTVYKKKEKIATGISKNLGLNYPDKSENDYNVTLSYVWGGRNYEEDICICYSKKTLDVSLMQPDTITPGEKVKIDVFVKDYKGRPVKDVNLTASSINSQFEELDVPDINLESGPTYRGKYINDFHKSNLFRSNKFDPISESWNKRFGLDSITYYQLKYPSANGFFYYDTVKAKVAQFAPFIYEKGIEPTIHLIKVDGVPIYYFDFDRNVVYSFQTSPGYHTITLRTSNKEIIIDSVLIKDKAKLLFSFELTKPNKNITIRKKKSYLNDEERKELLQYMLVVKTNLKFAYVTGKQSTLSLPSWRTYKMLFSDENLKLYAPNQEPYNINRKDAFEYSIYTDSITRQPIDKRAWNIYLPKKDKLYSHTHPFHSFNDRAMPFEDVEWTLQYHYPKDIYVKPFNPEYTEEGKGALHIDNFSYHVNQILLYNSKDTFEFNSYRSTIINIPEGWYKIKYYYKDKRIVETDSMFVRADHIFLRRDTDSTTGFAYAYTGLKPSSYTKKESMSIYKNDYGYGHRLYHEKYLDFLDLSIGDLLISPIPYIFSRRKKFNYTSIGASIKSSYFNGDIAGKNNFMHPGFGIQVTTKFHPRISTRRELSYLKLIGENKNSGLNFRNNLIQYSASGIIDLFGNKGRYSKRPKFNFYGHAGMSILYSNPQSFVNGKWTNMQPLRSEGVHYHKINFAVPVGLGFRYRFAKLIDLELDWTHSFALTDYLDDVSSRGNKANDQFGAINLRINYIIPSRVVCPKFRTARYRHEEGDYLVGVAGRSSGFEFDGFSSEESEIALSNYDGNQKVIFRDGNDKHKGFAKFELGQADQDVPDYAELTTEVDSVSAAGSSPSSIRSNFKDYAYWQPNLITDENGKASFEVTFPENITMWNSYVLAMSATQSGKTFKDTKSFKPVMANLYVPRFLIEGDVSSAIGKSLNYSGDTLAVTTTFKSGNFVMEEARELSKSFTEDFKIKTGEDDTLTVAYALKMNGGYSDGEERKIPVFKKGVLESKGEFMGLEKDTTFQIKLDSSKGVTTIYIDNNPLEILLKEIEGIKDYEYFCMEQAASKLNALLMEKNIRKAMGQKFKGEYEIRSLIKKLENGMKVDHTWGWWENSPSNYYMTVYIRKVLKKAIDEGYTVNVRVINYHLPVEIPEKRNSNIHLLSTLFDLKTNLNYPAIIDSIEKKFPHLSMQEKMELIHLKQKMKLPYEIQEVLKNKKSTFTEGMYWGEERYDLYENSVQSTILAYNILRNHGGFEKELSAIRNYFFETRRKGCWRNTYESALILETILPDLLKEKENKAAKIVLSGAVNQEIIKFPYTTKIKSSETLNIKKEGTTPVYFTYHQQEWNSTPSRVENDFKINTHFVNEKQAIENLKTGKESTLIVEVEAKHTGEYVMIEVPIPAGCSYGEKVDETNPYEIHREYYKNKTSIFCERLPEGKHIFKITLQPRFKGEYTLNPAKAELMYYPIFYGREELKKTVIEE